MQANTKCNMWLISNINYYLRIDSKELLAQLYHGNIILLFDFLFYSFFC